MEDEHFDDDLDSNDDAEDENYTLSSRNELENIGRLNRRQQIEQLLEDKRLTLELDSYDHHLSRKSNDDRFFYD